MMSRWRLWVLSLLMVALGVALAWVVFRIVDRPVMGIGRSQLSEPLRQVEASRQVEGAAVLSEAPAELPRNLIIFVADGLGFAHLSASRAVLHGIDGPAVWDRFTATGWQRTHPVEGFLTDSAAAATALATGQPTYPGGIAVDAEGQTLETLFERATELGYRTGVVTDSYVWEATPAAFVAHAPRRGNASAESILQQLGDSSLEVLAGELEDVGEGSVPGWAASVELLSERFEVLGPESSAELLEALESSTSPTAAIFEEDQLGDLESNPTLPALVRATLRRLSSTDQPFLLLVESEEPDSASHDADLDRLLRGMQAIEASLEILLDFAAEDQETLLVLTSDHETGGLVLGAGPGGNTRLKSSWTTTGHTGTVVPVLAFGPGASAFGGIHANWEIGRLLRQRLVD